MAFEVFTDTGVRTKEYISITENRAFGFPRPFIDKQGITNDQKCIILYDDTSNEIALHFSNLNPKFGLAVQIPNDKQGGMVSARTFFNVKGINASKYAGRYEDFRKLPLRSLGLDKDGDAYVIKLVDKSKRKPIAKEEPVQPTAEDNKTDSPVDF